jgi:hypothetical protein
LIDRMGGAALLGLAHASDVFVNARNRGLNGVGAMACDHNNARRVERLARAQRMRDQWRAADLVQNFGQVGVHPAALTCGQND